MGLLLYSRGFCSLGGFPAPACLGFLIPEVLDVSGVRQWEQEVGQNPGTKWVSGGASTEHPSAIQRGWVAQDGSSGGSTVGKSLPILIALEHL